DELAGGGDRRPGLAVGLRAAGADVLAGGGRVHVGREWRGRADLRPSRDTGLRTTALRPEAVHLRARRSLDLVAEPAAERIAAARRRGGRGRWDRAQRNSGG